MAMSKNTETREFDKFEGTERENTSVRVTQYNQLISEKYDFVDVDYTDGNPTLITYKIGGSGGTTVATVTITYTAEGCVNTITKA